MIKTSITIKDDKKLWNALVRQVKKTSSPNGNAVEIGLFQEQGRDLVDYAAYNEFGVPEKNIPERRFMRLTFDEWANAMYRKLEDNILPVLLERFPKQKLLNQTGTFMTKAMKRKIRSSRSWAAKNAPSTIANKGKGKPPLIDTRRMVNSITHRITKDSKEQSIRSMGL